MSIKALDKSTVKKITTTQVITSVYSAVKELVENALDAGANNIEVILQKKGLSLIEVRDNGSGIAEVDTPFMGLQAYTSKLADFNDLDSLKTYGFRGEALSALCRVATVKIITRTTADDAARFYTLDIDGKILKAEFSHRPIGTTVRIENLFENYPVRRQSISSPKKINQDIKDVKVLLKDYGICRSEVRFNFLVDNSSHFTKQPKGGFKQSLIEIYGTKIISNYKFLNVIANEICVELAIPQKNLSDLTLISQTVFAHISINTRPIIYKEFKDLILELLFKHFNGKTSSKKKPLIFLKIVMPPSYIDINLEPNKTTVLLKNKSEVLGIVKKLMADYYGLEIEPEEADTSMVETPAYFDTTMDDNDNEKEAPAKRKRKVPISTKIFVKKKKSNSDDNDDNNESNMPSKIKEEQWSRGHFLNLQGGTNVTIEGPSSKKSLKNLSKPNKTLKQNSDLRSKGFLKFCQDTRISLLQKNPQMTSVELAKVISKEWQQLDSKERQHFRDVGKRNSLSNLTVNSQLNRSHRKVPASPQIRQKNKNRLLELIQKGANCYKQPIKTEPSEEIIEPSILWDINMANIKENFVIHSQNIRKNKTSVIGRLNDDIWLINFNAQIWILNSIQLFDGLNLTSSEIATNKDNPDVIEDYLNSWFNEKNDMSLLYPILDLN